MGHKYDPDYAVHPGETVKDCMEMHNMTPHGVAAKFGSSTTDCRVTSRLAGEITQIGLGERIIENKHALAFAMAFHTSIAFWLDRQRIYDERVAAIERGQKAKLEYLRGFHGLTGD